MFTDEYQIEHVIPQSRFFDDSLSNKVICEAAVNAQKGAQLGLEFIKKHGGEIIEIGLNKKATVLNEKEYKELVNELFANNRGKKAKLLMEEIPEKMVERQLNDTRYISKFISQILSNIVRSPQEDEGVNSKNIIPCTGKITAALKQDWGLNDVWNDLILPRFERMNNLTQTELFTTYSEKYQKKIPTVPLEHAKGFQKKRIDHRHHALDALVVACATRSHINYMNNQHALDKHKAKEERQNTRIDLRTVLCEKKYNDNAEDKYNWTFKKPWNTFTQDVRSALEMVVVSFKQNLRVINKATNYYEKWVEERGKMVKKKVKQEGINWAIRKPLHKETISGKITLERVKVGKGKILTATRKSIDSSFTEKTIASITDTGVQKILLNYLAYKGSPELAFSPEGIEEMNKNIAQYNDGKDHQPIYKVRIFEEGSKFPLGEIGTKSQKYVETAKGTNLYFGVYQSKEKRSYATIPLDEVIERQKQGLTSVPELNEKGEKLLFSLSPNDLVYVPMEGEDTENIDFTNLSKEQRERIYKIVNFSKKRLYGVPNIVAVPIIDKMEYTQYNKIEFLREKDSCIKLKIDRLGNISKA